MIGLVRYDAMCSAIAACYSVDEVKDLRDKARALEVYAQQAQNTDAERKAAEIRIRAERRAGILLREMKEKGQRQKPGSAGPTVGRGARSTINDQRSTPQLNDLHITKDQSSKWQQLAEVPEKDFEQAVRSEGPKPTTEGIINATKLKAHPMPKQMDPDALFFWGSLRDFDRKRLFQRDPVELVDAMTDSMRDDTERIIPQMRAWLDELGATNGTKRTA